MGIQASWVAKGQNLPGDSPGLVYALSEELTVVPEPVSVLSGIIGLGMVGAWQRKRKRVLV